MSNILKTVVAFANIAGGDLVVGVEDRTRVVTSVGNPLGLEERLASKITGTCKGPKAEVTS